MTLKERLQLVAAGYKAKQIEAMIIEEAAETSVSEEPAENTSKGDEVTDQAKEQPETVVDEKEADPDYKTMFENLSKEYEETKAKLEAAQKINVSANVSENVKKEDSQTTINNIFKEIIS